MKTFTRLLLIPTFAIIALAGPHQAEKQKGPKKPPPPPPSVTVISQKAADWTFIKPGNSQNVPNHPTALPGGIGWTTLIPRSPNDADPCPGFYPECAWLGYFMTPYTTPLLNGHSISYTFEVTVASGNPQISFQTEDGNTIAGNCTTPANIRPYFEVKNEDDNVPTDRWWYDPATVPAQPGGGPVTITAMIDPALWSDADGHTGTQVSAKFAAALKNVGNVGATAGGGCFFGHGVYAVGGTANLILRSIGAN